MDEHRDEIEQMLLEFRPKGPPAALRNRVLSGKRSQALSTTVRAWGKWISRAAVAAALIVTIALESAGRDVLQETIMTTDILYTEHTPNIERLSEMSEAERDEWEYVIRCLADGHTPAERFGGEFTPSITGEEQP